MLLLLESDRISLDTSSEISGTAHDRVIRGIFQQYIDNDSGFAAPTRKENVPRFLLNDIVRFWRTMCVDFAYKQREQQGKKWALRNIELRMSRRLIFVKGLLMCFKIYNTALSRDKIKQELRKFVSQKPLQFMVSVFEENDVPDNYIVDLLDAYDKYLGMLNDEQFRDHLKNLLMHKAYEDPKFEEARANSHKFQNTLNKIFIGEKNKVSEFTLKYGVF
ncbi:MAG TPA: hypothetical protein VK588_15865 [Chitinophagaceae bacterium]|nr:hypothetical protein [Chitinophagaceae bacterium]